MSFDIAEGKLGEYQSTGEGGVSHATPSKEKKKRDHRKGYGGKREKSRKSLTLHRSSLKQRSPFEKKKLGHQRGMMTVKTIG